MGVRRSLRTLTSINQKDGYDCQSCAWPDPDGTRHVAEFCENGAKAVAWEATAKKVGPEFFAKHSVADLAAHNEQRLRDPGRTTQTMGLPPGSQHHQAISWPAAVP